MIKLSFKENSKGKFVLKIIQNNVLFYQKEYDANKKIVGDPFYDNQKDLMKDFVNNYIKTIYVYQLNLMTNFLWYYSLL